VNALLDAAVDLAAREWSVLPLRPRGKAPLGALAPHGVDDATVDPAAVERWWRRAPTANVGLACAASGLVAVDVDPRHGGDDRLHELERALGPLPDTPRALTGGGGLHVLLAHPGGRVRGELAPGVELKAVGYVVAAPSVHPSGRRYEWDIAPDEAPIAPAPERWARAMAATDPRPATPADGAGEDDDPLLEIPPARYLERLAGVRVGRDGKARCPLHDDGTPSLHAYRDGRRGWYCYGCRRGGTIYTLAALLAGLRLPVRDAAFLTVQEELWREFYPEVFSA
jgi:hypothetical protein